MPMYYFHLRNQDHITDVDGTELPDIEAAREHAETVALELTFKSHSFMDEPGRIGLWSFRTATVWKYFPSRCPTWGMETASNRCRRRTVGLRVGTVHAIKRELQAEART